MKKFKIDLTNVVLALLYILFSVRYYPGDPVNTIVETLSHLLSVGAICLGLTIFLIFGLERLAGEKLPLDRVIRIFLTIGILVEFFYGLYDYLGKNAG